MHRYELVPELKAWDAHNGDEQTPVGWVSCVGTFSLAVAYASLLWPQFSEVRGMVFRGEAAEPEIDSWLVSTNHDLTAVEATLNHLHILDVQNPGIWNEATEAQLRFIGETLKASWAAKLALDFPGRQFVVEFTQGSAISKRKYQVFFYEKRDASYLPPARSTTGKNGDAEQAGRDDTGEA
jgi:hypothetical protein